ICFPCIVFSGFGPSHPSQPPLEGPKSYAKSHVLFFFSLSLSSFPGCFFLGGWCLGGGLTGNLRGFSVATAPVLQQFFPQATRHSLLGPPPVSLKPPQLGFPALPFHRQNRPFRKVSLRFDLDCFLPTPGSPHPLSVPRARLKVFSSCSGLLLLFLCFSGSPPGVSCKRNYEKLSLQFTSLWFFLLLLKKKSLLSCRIFPGLQRGSERQMAPHHPYKGQARKGLHQWESSPALPLQVKLKGNCYIVLRQVGQNSCPDVAGLGTSSLPASPRELSRAPLPFAPLCQVLSNAGALKVTIQQSSESRAISTTPAIKPGPSGPPLQAPPGAALNYFCYVCRTNCCNQQSFQTHLSGVPHQQRLQEVQERSKVCLVPKLPLGKEDLNSQQRWCNTCQVNFRGDLIKHRRTQGHKLAKRFLRPFCTVCSRYFKTPRKFVEHMKSLEHKQKTREVRLGEKDLGGPEDSEELITVDAVGCFEEQDEEEDEEEEEEEVGQRETSVEDPGGNAKYSPDTVYGLDFLVPVAGFLCRLCHKFYSSDSATRLTHCKSRMHFENLQVSPSFLPSFLLSSPCSFPFSPSLLFFCLLPPFLTLLPLLSPSFLFLNLLLPPFLPSPSFPSSFLTLLLPFSLLPLP
uniref:Matrin-type domain-containing protein n=1 Tax=Laticauda laticaudata TaxID=8630 RepID=A0A8C5S759_LATLA